MTVWRGWAIGTAAKGTQYALRHTHHSGADGKGFGSDIPVGNDNLQLADGVVPAVQILATERIREAKHQLVRRMGAIFAKKSVDFEFSVTNNIVQKERFRYFIKVPELAAFFSSQLGVKINARNCYDAYLDIKRRKNDSRTYFLDRMRERLNLRMQRDDGK